MEWIKRIFRRENKEEMRCSAVIVAAGNSTRMGGTDKIMAPLGEYPVIGHTVLALNACPQIDEIVIVTRGELIVQIGQLCRELDAEKVTRIVVGGETRQQSVSLGIQQVDEQADLIAIHDGARPFVSQRLLREVIQAAGKSGAAAPAVPVKDTVKRAVDGQVLETLDRSQLFAVQTPQVFDASLIRAAIHQVLEENASVTDDCMAVERLGMSVTLTQGEYENMKITTPVDLILGEALLNREEV